MAKYRNTAIKGFDKNTGEPIGDPDLIMYLDQQQTLKDSVYPSQKDMDSFNDSFGDSFVPKSSIKKSLKKEVRKVADYKPKYSQRDKFNYRAKKCKPGSTYVDSEGKIKNYSDFKRGEMCGRNKEAARSLWIRKKKGEI